MLQFAQILAQVLSPQHAVTQKHWLVFKQLVYVTFKYLPEIAFPEGVKLAKCT